MLLSDLHLQRWRAVVPTLPPPNPAHAIPAYWLAHPELGSPLGGELDLTDDPDTQATAGMACACGIILWSASRGPWVHGQTVPERVP